MNILICYAKKFHIQLFWCQYKHWGPQPREGLGDLFQNMLLSAVLVTPGARYQFQAPLFV